MSHLRETSTSREPLGTNGGRHVIISGLIHPPSSRPEINGHAVTRNLARHGRHVESLFVSSLPDQSSWQPRPAYSHGRRENQASSSSAQRRPNHDRQIQPPQVPQSTSTHHNGSYQTIVSSSTSNNEVNATHQDHYDEYEDEYGLSYVDG
ncbi:hypothetical protein H2248_008760 [Termitomyces sp. 'cryptogamus']|nr:hypothetical protein H2248_008760 [Termitomyces sp. 'cryptogamus']